jgi:cytochrome c5
LRKFLPIVLMALAVQILAPIAACRAAGIVASDPLAAATICHDASNQADQPGQTGRHAHDSTCALCCLAHAGISLDAPKTAVAAPYRHALPVVWHDVDPELRDSRTSGHAQARAPLAIS